MNQKVRSIRLSLVRNTSHSLKLQGTNKLELRLSTDHLIELELAQLVERTLDLDARYINQACLLL